MSDILPLKKGIIYGPVNSRRLGRSLGINLLPPDGKWCTFDCVYCQYGWTPASGHSARRDGNMGAVPSVSQVAAAVEEAIGRLEEPPAYLTFSGNGEPTLHPEFAGMVEAVREIRDRRAPRARTALLSNSTRITDASVRAAIARIDRPHMKLDAGNEAMFRAFNRPAAGIRFRDIVDGLKETPGISLQALFCGGSEGNLIESHIADWIETVSRIRPREVQIYTISRGVPARDLIPVKSETLADIRDRLRARGTAAEIF